MPRCQAWPLASAYEVNNMFQRPFWQRETEPNIVHYTARLGQQRDGDLTISFCDIPETIPDRDTLDEALFNASKALMLALEQRIEENDTLPRPTMSKASGWKNLLHSYKRPLSSGSFAMRKAERRTTYRGR